MGEEEPGGRDATHRDVGRLAQLGGERRRRLASFSAAYLGQSEAALFWVLRDQ